MLCHDNKTFDDCGKYLCGFWDEKVSIWSQSGCVLKSMRNSSIECQCNHLTNFAILFVSYVKNIYFFAV